MRIFAICMQCQAEKGIPNFSSCALVEIPESGWIEITCDNDHRSVMIIQEGRFEILSAMGLNAIAKGFYRDAILSLTTSLERLYELFIQATCRKHGISAGAFAASWKQMTNQSERQLGAFIAAFMFAAGEAPKLLPQEQVAFRNSVVHKGKFPTRDETIDFGRAVFDCAHSVLRVLRAAPYAGIMEDLIFERIEERSRHARNEGLPFSTMSINPPLSTTSGELGNFETLVAAYADGPDLESSIDEVRRFGAMIDSVLNGNN